MSPRPAPVPSVDDDWPFVARAEELGLLTAAIEEGAAHPGRPSGAVVVAPSGIGKTRLLLEAARWSRRHGHEVVTVIGTRAAAATPYAALAHLAAPGSTAEHSDVGALYRGFAQALGGDGRRRVLVVDDAHLLDQGSAALVLYLAMTGTATVLVVVRRNEAVPDPITTLWKDGLAPRIDLQGFSREETEALIERALGAEVEGRTRWLLAQTSDGNALYTRELVRGLLSAGSLRLVDGRWTWDGAVVLAPRLVDAIGHRIAELTLQDRETLSLVALAEPLRLAVAERVAESASIARLENAALVQVSGRGTEAICRIEHPLYGEVVLAHTGRLDQRRLMRVLADALAERGADGDENLMRVATWRLDAGGAISSEELGRAAELANRAFAYPLAERLGRAAEERGGDALVQVALGQAMNGQRRYAEAEELLTRAEDVILRTDDAALHRRYLDRRFLALYFGLGRRDETNRMLDGFEQAHRDVGGQHGEDARNIVAGYRAMVLLDDGDLPGVLDQVEHILAAPNPEAQGLMIALQASGEAMAYLGATDSARVLHGRLRELAARGDPETSKAGANAALQEMLCQILEGRVAELLPVVSAYYDQVVGSRDDITRGLTALPWG
ncbi:MAG: AAA family ATPase [Mycobacteriales bacterium]